MNTTETITWIPVEDRVPAEEGLYLVNRFDGQYSSVIMENWEILPHEGLKIAQWDGDPPHGGARDGGYPEEGPVVAWAEMPTGYVGM
jgi:hypothetical protein